MSQLLSQHWPPYHRDDQVTSARPSDNDMRARTPMSQDTPRRPDAPSRPRYPRSFMTLAAVAFGLLPLSSVEAKDYPAPIEALEKEGLEVHGEFDAPGGLEGYAASHRGQPMTIFVTADGEHAIVGNLIDGEANNLSEEPLERLVQGPQDEAVWQELADSAWIADGDPDASRTVYVFTDPNCPYCTRLWQMTRPFVESGEVQLRHVMVGILDPASPRQAVTMLAADDPSAALAAHEGGDPITPMRQLPRDLEQRLQSNHELFRGFGMVATPGMVYRHDGKVEMTQGLPGQALFETIMGSASP
ncbi:thiol:disulfide interchange protein DsbG [Halomonas sp. DP8Y7-3]|uniref:thiol:disulfide interchange protein DsbG n=1 Tax=Halomonas sp. DP8Y7-3 TaxID=2859079 RepID=UPI0021BD8DF1|nr:thiol:disulfide interchange protein DsbG [Halomonas sp. DP8Y7-3]